MQNALNAFQRVFNPLQSVEIVKWLNKPQSRRRNKKRQSKGQKKRTTLKSKTKAKQIFVAADP